MKLVNLKVGYELLYQNLFENQSNIMCLYSCWLIQMKEDTTF